jgi:hypothetical protein
VYGGLFVAYEDVLELVLLEDLVVDRQDGASRIAEYELDPRSFPAKTVPQPQRARSGSVLWPACPAEADLSLV